MRRRDVALLALGVALILVGCQSGSGVDGRIGNVLGAVTQGLTGTTAADFRGATTEIEEAEEIELGRAVTTALGSRYKLLRNEPLTR